MNFVKGFYGRPGTMVDVLFILIRHFTGRTGVYLDTVDNSDTVVNSDSPALIYRAPNFPYNAPWNFGKLGPAHFSANNFSYLTAKIIIIT